MKKIFTLLVAAAGTIGFASAQSHSSKDMGYYNTKQIRTPYDQHSAFDKYKNVGYNDNRMSYKEEQAQLEKINREFDWKISSVKSNWHLSRWEKAKQIQVLKDAKQNEISKVQYDFARSNQQGRGKMYGHDGH